MRASDGGTARRMETKKRIAEAILFSSCLTRTTLFVSRSLDLLLYHLTISILKCLIIQIVLNNYNQ